MSRRYYRYIKICQKMGQVQAYELVIPIIIGPYVKIFADSLIFFSL